jgi:hypothetical protein
VIHYADRARIGTLIQITGQAMPEALTKHRTEARTLIASSLGLCARAARRNRGCAARGDMLNLLLLGVAGARCIAADETVCNMGFRDAFFFLQAVFRGNQLVRGFGKSKGCLRRT